MVLVSACGTFTKQLGSHSSPHLEVVLVSLTIFSALSVSGTDLSFCLPAVSSSTIT